MFENTPFRKLLRSGLLAIILSIGIFFGLAADKEIFSAPMISEGVILFRSSKSSGIADHIPQDESARVIRVIDGDTIEIEGGERVRYIGIDTPETVDPRKIVQCFGAEASRKNKEIVLGKIVRLEKDITDRDKYGRMLRYVWLGETLINKTLVEKGFAYSYSYPPNIKYQNLFVEAEKKARESGSGLWGGCKT